MITSGMILPNGTLQEFYEQKSDHCQIGPNTLDVEKIILGKKVIIFGVPGAFTSTCSEHHLPGYLNNYDLFKSRGIDEIWCISVNDAFVMHAWGKEKKCIGKIRMMADGNGNYTKEMGLITDLSQYGLGIRSKRYAMIVENSVVKYLTVEEAGQFETSSAQSILKII